MRNIDTKLAWQEGRIIVDRFEADRGSGKVLASGSLNMTDTEGPEGRIDIVLKEAGLIVPVNFLKSFESKLSGELSITGNQPPFKVAGNVTIDEARATREVDLRNEIINALRRQSFSTAKLDEQPSLLFDLNLRADETIKIHNRNLQGKLSADLQILGTDIAPTITGQMEVNRGMFVYKRDFEINRGLVTFDDPVTPDPNLDIVSSADIGNYRVFIDVNGRASNPTVEFSVDPPTREDGTVITKVEILVLLTKGSLPDTDRSMGETQNTATTEAINLIMGQFEEPVEKLFDLTGQSYVRNVFIDTYASDEGNPVPRLNLPLDLGEEFDVVIRTDQSTNAVTTEYNLHDNVTFSSSFEKKKSTGSEGIDTTSPEENAKVDLKFRFSFD